MKNTFRPQAVRLLYMLPQSNKNIWNFISYTAKFIRACYHKYIKLPHSCIYNSVQAQHQKIKNRSFKILFLWLNLYLIKCLRAKFSFDYRILCKRYFEIFYEYCSHVDNLSTKIPFKEINPAK